MERKERKRKRSVNYDEVRQHVPPVKVGEESLLNISNVSDLSEELALDNYTETISDVEDEVVAAKHNCKKDFAVSGTFSHVTFEDSDSDVAPSPRKLLGRTQRPSNNISMRLSCVKLVALKAQHTSIVSELFQETLCSNSDIDLFESNPSFWQNCGAAVYVDDANEDEALQCDLAEQGSDNEEELTQINVSNYNQEAEDIYNTLFHHTDMSVKFEHLTNPVQADTNDDDYTRSIHDHSTVSCQEALLVLMANQVKTQIVKSCTRRHNFLL
ncbi:hypothetical protein OS493_037325 [Desmophyllum pertusum]|uniref:Uncharacterized protein n=1 Tax=Desmophyllum pertusum TaxID=174260 RepID=A0A9X0CMW9_9CNID|nr:hypothetical protein OS493_037325 [Desmophyllum pertusum]